VIIVPKIQHGWQTLWPNPKGCKDEDAKCREVNSSVAKQLLFSKSNPLLKDISRRKYQRQNADRSKHFKRG
jgi:hypothetical protein